MAFIPSNIPVNLCKIGTIRNKTRLCALVLAFLFVSLNAGCKEQSAEKSGTDRFFITPTSIDATDNAFAIGSFHYTLPEEGGILSLSVEQWNGEGLISQQILPVPLNAGQSGEVTLRLTMEAMKGTDSRSVCWVGQSNAGKASVSLPVPWDLGVMYSFWSPGDAVWYQTWTEATLEEGLILACLGTGNLEQGLPSLSCSAWMEDPSQFSQFLEIQLIRAIVTKA